MSKKRDLYISIIQTKEKELSIVKSELEESRELLEQQKLFQKADRLAGEIDDLYEKLTEIDSTNNDNKNNKYLNLEKTFRKIDNTLGKDIAKSINDSFGSNSGAALLFLQGCYRKKGKYCLEELLDLMLSDNKIGDENWDNERFKKYEINLDSAISQCNEHEFSKLLSTHFTSSEESLDLKDVIKRICLSLRGGFAIFIQINNCGSIIKNNSFEEKGFLHWFIENFWTVIINELKPIFSQYSQIRFVVALTAKNDVFENCCSLEYFCHQNNFDKRKIIEIPLQNWTIKDIQDWLITFRGFSDENSLNVAEEIHDNTKGVPHTVCSYLKEELKVCR